MLFFRLRASPVVSTNLKTLANIAKPTPNMQTQHLNRQFLGCYSNCSLGRVFSSTISPLSLSPSLSLSFSSPTLAMPFLTKQLAARFLESNLYPEYQQKVCLLVPLRLSHPQHHLGFSGANDAFEITVCLLFTNAVRVCDWFAFSRVFCIIAMYLLSFSFFYYCYVSCISTCIWVTNFLVLLCFVMFWGKIFIGYWLYVLEKNLFCFGCCYSLWA